MNCHLDTNGIRPKYGDTVLYETINSFIKTKLYGSDKDYYFIEYDWHGNIPNVEFPWKRQFIFNAEGRLLQIMAVLKIRLLSIFPKENPFLITVFATAHGNGGHEIYRIHSIHFLWIHRPKQKRLAYGCCVKTQEFGRKLSLFCQFRFPISSSTL